MKESKRIETPRLRLELSSKEELLQKFSNHPEVSANWLAKIRNSSQPDPWLYGFSIALKENSLRIGDAGFKGPPDTEGAVEIAFGVDPQYEGRGFATEAAEALTEHAFRDSRVKIVRAHTLKTGKASQRILEKCQFKKLGEVHDPEDGLVLRFEKVRPLR